MRPGAAGGHCHDAICYDSDDHLLAVAVPFLLGAAAAGEPALVSLSERTADLIRAALPVAGGPTFVGGPGVYARPAEAIREYREVLARHFAGGAGRIRVLGELPREALGATWDWWARYEATVNHAFGDFPVWSMCAYDTRVTPAPVLDDVLRTHPRTARPGGRRVPNESYTDPVVFLAEPRPPVPDPLEITEPVVDLTGPTAVDARRSVRDADCGVLTPRQTEELLLAVSETVDNAHRHGRGPVRLRIWTGADRVVVAVCDGGAGPRDPFAGMLPARERPDGGLGLWLTHLFCAHVAMRRRPDGFTLRLTAGDPYWDRHSSAVVRAGLTPR